jgi:transposase-like protein
MPASILGEVGHLSEAALTRNKATRLSCPSCGSGHVALVLGDNGGISYVCTACGHSWS